MRNTIDCPLTNVIVPCSRMAAARTTSFGFTNHSITIPYHETQKIF